jgi:hypothetical protein
MARECLCPAFQVVRELASRNHAVAKDIVLDRKTS